MIKFSSHLIAGAGRKAVVGRPGWNNEAAPGRLDGKTHRKKILDKCTLPMVAGTFHAVIGTLDEVRVRYQEDGNSPRPYRAQPYLVCCTVAQF